MRTGQGMQRMPVAQGVPPGEHTRETVPALAPARIGRRFRLFFRYDSTAKLIVYVWASDEHTLREAGSKTDPDSVFRRMLARGNPPDDWEALVSRSLASWPTEE